MGPKSNRSTLWWLARTGWRLKPPVAMPDTAETVLGVDGRPRQMITIGIPTSGVVIHGSAASLATMVDAISRFTLKPVVDMTGVQGQHQFDLTFEPETMGSFQSPRVSQTAARSSPGDPAPPLSAAIQEYGLKLETRKGADRDAHWSLHVRKNAHGQLNHFSLATKRLSGGFGNLFEGFPVAGVAFFNACCRTKIAVLVGGASR